MATSPETETDQAEAFVSAQYWENRYRRGRNSGKGSYGRLALYKAAVLNGFVAANGVETVVEFGSGDGNQLRLATYPSYVGYDVSRTAIDLCRTQFASDRAKTFHHLDEYEDQHADLTLSLDVVFHLVEDVVFASYMKRLFDASRNFVAIYATNWDSEQNRRRHVRHRRFTSWINANIPDFRFMGRLDNTVSREATLAGRQDEISPATFHFYARNTVVPEDVLLPAVLDLTSLEAERDRQAG